MNRERPMWRRYLTLTGRDAARDLRDEISFHIESRTEELIARGWTLEAAAEEARRSFGDLEAIASQCREIDARVDRERRMTHYLEDVKTDVGYALRQFRRQPRFWSVIALTLIVGIGASTAIFAVVDGVMLKPLLYPEPGRLVSLATSNWRGEVVELAERGETMEVAAYYPSRQEVTLNAADEPMRLAAAGVSANLFDLLGVSPVLGRAFTVDETHDDGPGILGGSHWRTYGVVMLSYGLWQRLYAGSRAAVGSTLAIDGLPHTVVGVLPQGFAFPSPDVELWFPHNIHPADSAFLWRGNVAKMIGRLHEGRTIDEARAELRALAPSFRDLIPWGQSIDPGYAERYDVRPLADDMIGNSRPALLVLLASVGALLLLLCVNIASLLLSRGVTRERELATRAAIGADRKRLIRQLVTENVTVALFAGALGAILSIVLVAILVGLLPPDLPRAEQIAVDGRVLLFAFGASLAVGLAFGLLPALRATHDARRLAARTARGVIGDTREGRLTRALAVVELAFAVVLAVSAVLLLLSLWNLTNVDPGFNSERLVAARVAPPGFDGRTPAEKAAFANRLVEALRAQPGITHAAAADAIPLDRGLYGNSISIEGLSRDGDGTFSEYHGVTSDFFDAMAVPLHRGRTFMPADDRLDARRVAIVSRTFADIHWPGENPIGRRIMFQDDRQHRDADGNWQRWFTIVGVVEDVRWLSVADETERMVYLPLAQHWDTGSLRVVLRTASDPDAIAAQLSAVVRAIDAGAAVSDVRSFDARLAESIARPRFTAYLLGGFAAVALFLAAIGVYGVLSYAASRRASEIGVRLAFGASTREAFLLLFGQGLTLTAAGIALGIPAALGAARLLESLLFGVAPLDLRALGAVVVMLLAVGIVVSYLPARRAALADPMSALRQS